MRTRFPGGNAAVTEIVQQCGRMCPRDVHVTTEFGSTHCIIIYQIGHEFSINQTEPFRMYKLTVCELNENTALNGISCHTYNHILVCTQINLQIANGS